MSVKLIHGDCLEEMPKLIKEGVKVDLILTDLPYGTTACKWDTVIPFKPMWKMINQLIKPECPVVLFGSEPFSTKLRNSNINEFKYDWIWEKPQGANFMQVKYAPYKVHEIISVFKNHNYYPLMSKGKPYTSGKGTSGDITNNVRKIQTKNNGTRYPRSILRFKQDKTKSKHPTEKPVKLLKYLILTYTKKRQTVLDFTMGGGSTAIACLQTRRNFIGIELNEDYFNIAETRVKNYYKNGGKI